MVVGVILVSNGNRESSSPNSAASTNSAASAAINYPSATVAGNTPGSSYPEAPLATTQEAKSDASLSSKEKGDLFEDFTVNLLADWRMKLLDRTQDKVSSAGVAAESCRQPDLLIQQKRGKSYVDYYLECKYRSDWKDGAVRFEDWQIKRYRDFQRSYHRKVLIALGVGGSPSKPATLMLVPVDSIKDNSISQIWVTRFAVQPSSDALASYIDAYFDEVFTAAKVRKGGDRSSKKSSDDN